MAAVVMAAGAGRRMGGRPKALLQRDGESLLARQIGLLQAGDVRQVVVVLGHHAERLQPLVAQLAADHPVLDLRSTRNPRPDDGTGGSLRCGLAALPPALDAVVVLLADQPLLALDDLRAVLAAWCARPPGIDLVVPTHAGQPGHPLVFGPTVRAAVQGATDSGGVREWRRAHPDRVQSLALAHARCTTDLDTPDDLVRLRDELGVDLRWPDAEY
ncbi:nucleotidyltransferase family protein [Ottowia sp. GY511]|uniref:NTP transferase domain-containing protein n=1 Tax=Ottowia flava TaxID=2675430 RepID=A0ABW4KVS9_9BURK|nr:nucleotidyltransferase family protein [Ottowia sp. GY511]TXK22400.1 nucleotidyltransferase family protein [Ottowia sp. GY511]